MSTDNTLILTLSRLEARHLADLVAQFVMLLTESDATDPAVQRLTPSAYPDDRHADAEFRHATGGDLLSRRQADAELMLSALAPAFAEGEESSTATIEEMSKDLLTVPLAGDAGWAWLRTLTAVRLVIASRLGIDTDDDHDPDDERFAVYDWLGYRLDGIVQTLNDT